MLKFCRNVSKKVLLTILIGTVSVLSSVTGSFGKEQKEMVVLIRMMVQMGIHLGLILQVQFLPKVVKVVVS